MSEKFLDAFKNLADNISGRTKKDVEAKKERRSREGEYWRIARGDFSRGFQDFDPAISYSRYRFDIKQAEKDLKFEEIRGLERIISNRIDQLLAVRKTMGAMKPVILVDFGGMYSLSFNRLALNKKEAIERGELVFVTTNINFNPADQIKKLEITGREEFKQEEIDLLRKTFHLVQYVNADAAELSRISVSITPNSPPYSLHGNIDILHENDALMHSRKPDVDLPLVARELSSDGILFLGSRSAHIYSGESREEFDIRDHAFKIGTENLKKTNLETVPIPSKSRTHYTVLIRTGAPPINLE